MTTWVGYGLLLEAHSITREDRHVFIYALAASKTMVFRWTVGWIKDTAPILKQDSTEAYERHGFQDPWPNIPRRRVTKQFLSVCDLSNVLKLETDPKLKAQVFISATKVPPKLAQTHEFPNFQRFGSVGILRHGVKLFYSFAETRPSLKGTTPLV